ncbi:hypothetical protein [Fibrisoma limi]|uniref:hypothetical protein n=1 Tax=Fibrisoma limi TaxID=663275 RepID=UPI000304C87D|nr:hypothetical protein [Fibrisoma limi]
MLRPNEQNNPQSPDQHDQPHDHILHLLKNADERVKKVIHEFYRLNSGADYIEILNSILYEYLVHEFRKMNKRSAHDAVFHVMEVINLVARLEYEYKRYQHIKDLATV